MRLLLRLWREESGTAGPEWALVATILVLVAVAGVMASRPVVMDEEPPPARVSQ
jgi:Flp pilus assembly pilin Flp